MSALANSVAFASVTASVVNLATKAIGTLGLAGVALLMLSTGVIGLPGSEPTMLFAGFDVFNGTLSLAGIIVFGVIGDVLGAMIAYSIGHYGRTKLVERHERRPRSRRHVERATRWLDQYGSAAAFCSRLVPVARAVFPYAAGVAEMPVRRFALLTTLGSIPYVVGLGILGREVGRNWASWRHHLEYVDYVVAVLVALAVAYRLVRILRQRDAGLNARGT
jgi:membrane protein DedA with SNARE-associated domain